MKKRLDNKGFILAFTVVFMAAVTLLLTLTVLSSSYPLRLCRLQNAKKEEMLALEALGKDFAANGRLDCEYSAYSAYFVECTPQEELCVRDTRTDKILLTVTLESGAVTSWRYYYEE